MHKLEYRLRLVDFVYVAVYLRNVIHALTCILSETDIARARSRWRLASQMQISIYLTAWRIKINDTGNTLGKYYVELARQSRRVHE